MAQINCFSLKILKTELLMHDLSIWLESSLYERILVFVNNRIFQLLSTHMQADLDIHISICVPKDFFKLLLI